MSHEPAVERQLAKPTPRLDIGIEVEGRYRGMRTVFVYGDVPVDRIKDSVVASGSGHVYFHEDCPQALVKRYLQADSCRLVTLETTEFVYDSMFLFHNLRVTLPLTNNIEKAIQTLGSYVEIYGMIPSTTARIQVRIDTYGYSLLADLDHMRVNMLSEILSDKTIWPKE